MWRNGGGMGSLYPPPPSGRAFFSFWHVGVEFCFFCAPSPIFLFAKEGRTMTSEGKGGTVFQEIRRGDGFKTGDFVDENLGGLPE